MFRSASRRHSWHDPCHAADHHARSNERGGAAWLVCRKSEAHEPALYREGCHLPGRSAVWRACAEPAEHRLGDRRMVTKNRMDPGVRDDERLSRLHGMLAERARQRSFARGGERFVQSNLALEELPMIVDERDVGDGCAQGASRAVPFVAALRGARDPDPGRATSPPLLFSELRPVGLAPHELDAASARKVSRLRARGR